MTIEEFVEDYWNKFKERTSIEDERVKRVFTEIMIQAFHETQGYQKICHKNGVRMVSVQSAKSGIPKLIKELNKDSSKRNAFCEIMNYVGNKPENDSIVSKKLLKELGWSGFTYGDFIVRCLDLLVCMGMLQKMRFARGKPGHKYIKKHHDCPFANVVKDFYGIPESYKCNFNWSEGPIIKGRYPEGR